MATRDVPTLDGSGRIFDKHIPARLQDGALNATYVTFVDSVTGLPIVGKHVQITVDTATDEIVDILVEDI